ncbi:hypothetical protein WM42_0707 [Corynebacterium simulans]|nr:hypothetical protein WM42_0707 [Corynebacterium simulans]
MRHISSGPFLKIFYGILERLVLNAKSYRSGTGRNTSRSNSFYEY